MGADLMQEIRPAAQRGAQRIGADHMTETVRREIAAAAAQSELFTKMDDHFRQLAARCFDEERGETQVLSVASSTVGDGTSSIVLGLASAAARNLGADVLIVETDLKRPQLARDLGMQAAIGLSDYLTRDVELGTIVSPTSTPRVWLLPVGRAVANPGPLVRSERFTQLLKNLRALPGDDGERPAFRCVIIDAPPLLTSSDAKVITQQSDGVLLVVRAGETHANDVESALRIAGKDHVRGIVLNRSRTWLPSWLTRIFGLSQFDFE